MVSILTVRPAIILLKESSEVPPEFFLLPTRYCLLDKVHVNRVEKTSGGLGYGSLFIIIELNSNLKCVYNCMSPCSSYSRETNYFKKKFIIDYVQIPEVKLFYWLKTQFQDLDVR